jgi:hypothetical protein
MSGSESRNVRNVSPFAGIDATAAKETLLFLLLIEQVLTFFNDTGLYFAMKLILPQKVS